MSRDEKNAGFHPQKVHGVRFIEKKICGHRFDLEFKAPLPEKNCGL